MILPRTGPIAPAGEPWRLIRDSIADLELQENTEGVRIAMGFWHDPDGSICCQCLAGAVMSRRLGADTEKFLTPGNFPEEMNRLEALDFFRTGGLVNAYLALGIPRPPGVPSRWPVTPHHEDQAAFKRSMRDLADLLEAAHKEDRP